MSISDKLTEKELLKILSDMYVKVVGNMDVHVLDIVKEIEDRLRVFESKQESLKDRKVCITV